MAEKVSSEKDSENDSDDNGISRDSFKSMVSAYWKDALFIAIILLFATLITSYNSELKQMPSPIYGGDYYHSLGYIEHFKSGGSAFVNSAFIGGLPSYFPTYTIMAGGIARIFSVDALQGMKAFSIIELFLAIVTVYILGNYVLKNKLSSMIFTILYLNFSYFPVFKYLQFTITFWFPLFLLAAYHFYKKQDLLSSVLLGLAYGLLGLSHSVAFVFASMFMAVLAVYLLILKHITLEKGFKLRLGGSFKKESLHALLLLLLVAAIGVSIAMIYWFKPVFVFHGEPLNPVQEFDQANLSKMSAQWIFTKNFFIANLFDFSNLFMGARSVLFLLGIIGLFLLKKLNENHKFLIMLLAASVIGSFHFLITQPLIGTNLSAEYISMISMLMTSAIIAGFGAIMIANLISSMIQPDKKKSGLIHEVILLVMTLIILFSSVSYFINYEKTDRWVAVGKTDLQPQFKELQDWVLANTDVNDVFLSTNELSFALNALTGRKLVVMKRGHTEMFTDANKNMLDATLILYSNDSETRKKILKERNVKYLFWQVDWISLEYRFDEQGRITSVFDPFLILDSAETRGALEANGIRYDAQNTWIDPAARYDTVKKFNALFIDYRNYRNYTHPWNPGLDEHIEEIWHYATPDGMVVSRIYRIVNVD